MEQQEQEYIDLREFCKKLFSKKILFIEVWVITCIVACIMILPIPRQYTASVQLIPESGGQSATISLTDLANSFELCFNDISSENTICPDIYPSILKTNEFIVSLFDLEVESKDHTIKTDYYTYLSNYQKKAYYKWPKIWLSRLLSLIIPNDDEERQTVPNVGGDGKRVIDPHRMNKHTTAIVLAAKNSINCVINKKTGIITISVSAQDPAICASLADHVSIRLQEFITDYRTQKARIDVAYHKQLLQDARRKYDDAMDEYCSFCDSHALLTQQSTIAQREKLNNELSMALTTYNSFNTQYQLALAKVQERTPSFTVLKGASVPIKADKPKRMRFVFIMLILSTLGVVVYEFRSDILNQLSHIQ